MRSELQRTGRPVLGVEDHAQADRGPGTGRPGRAGGPGLAGHVELAFVELAETGVEVAADGFDGEIGAELAELCGAAKGAGADAGAGLEIGETLADQGVTRVFARGNGGQDETVGEFRREILEAVDGEVGPAVE